MPVLLEASTLVPAVVGRDEPSSPAQPLDMTVRTTTARTAGTVMLTKGVPACARFRVATPRTLAALTIGG